MCILTRVLRFSASKKEIRLKRQQQPSEKSKRQTETKCVIVEVCRKKVKKTSAFFFTI